MKTDTVHTADIALSVLRKHVALVPPERYGYPEILSLQAAANLELATGDPELREWNRSLLRPLLAGELTQRMGAYRLYNIGGAAAAKLLWQGELPEAESPGAACARELVDTCPRHPDGFFAYQTNDRWQPHQVWIDMAFATCPFLTYAGLHFQRNDYLEEAARQVRALHGLFHDAECGLFNQAVGIRSPDHRTGDHWSRGNGWGALALAEVAANLPEHTDGRAQAVGICVDHLDACLRYQDEQGVWHQDMTDPLSYVETSGTGLILYALGLALEHNLCPAEWRSGFLRGLRGYMQYIAVDGSVHNCCVGCMCPGNGTAENYTRHPYRLNDHHAFGPAALAFGQARKLGVETLPIQTRTP